jgi:uncharacterized protein YbcV (DUF1398 family)
MFTIEQIKQAHSKVKTGTDFPRYVQDLIQLGVTSYETWVTDGHTDYAGAGNYAISSPAKYDTLIIADKSDAVQFVTDLKAHQQGKTDYLSFCRDSAASGVVKWVSNLTAMTCTYFDKDGMAMLVENIPVP